MTETKGDGAGQKDSLTGALLGLRRSRVSANESEPSRTWNAEDWAEDQRYIDALDAIGRGLKRDALTMLVNLYKEDPGHLFGRALLLTLAVETGNQAMAHEHLEWAIGFHAQQSRPQEACEAYRSARAAFPALAWNEKPLVQVLVCAERCGDRRAVVDATKFLYASYPQSAALPKAFLASAAVQEAEGRDDLAKATLQAIVQRFPLDPIAELAKRKLRELSTTSDPASSPPASPPAPASKVAPTSSPQATRTTSPAQVAPVQVAPVQVAPVQVAPVQAAPVQAAPVQVAPVQVAPPPSHPEVVTQVAVRPSSEERMSLLEQATRAPLLPVRADAWEASLPELPAAPMESIHAAGAPARLPERPVAMLKEIEQPWAASLAGPIAPEPTSAVRASPTVAHRDPTGPEPAPAVQASLSTEAHRVAKKAAKEARGQRRTRPDPRVDPESLPAGPPSDAQASSIDVPGAPRLPRP